MTIRNLDITFAPTSVALIVAAARYVAWGKGWLRNVLAGGFAGKVFLVNPKYD